VLSDGAGNPRQVIDNNGRVGINSTSPYTLLTIQGNSTGSITGAPALSLYDTNSSSSARNWAIGTNIGAGSAGQLNFVVSSAQGGTPSATTAMSIDSSGNLLVNSTEASISSGTGFKFLAGTSQPAMGIVINNATAGSNYHLYNTNATNNGYRFYVKNDGGISNFSANNVNLSDERTKKDIANAGNYLDKICAIPVRTFLYKDQSDEQLSLGVIAQEVEVVAPELVDASGFGETPDDGIPLKAIYQTDLQYALMKAIQELNAEVQALKQQLGK
jgi:hypothetical protein